MPEDAKERAKLFGSDFFWGASTAGHQVEGGLHDQWTVWELENAAELAKTAPERLSWLPDWSKIEAKAKEPKTYISGKGVEHEKRYQKDFDLLEELNLNSFRFSIEWSRLQPREGVWDHRAIEHYHRYIDALIERRIEPFLNIWHWTMPVWFTDKGGFEKKENLKYFRDYVTKIADEYGHKVRYVITLNEPNVYSTFGYITGEWPPGIKSWPKFIKVYWHLTRAHRQAYKILKKCNPKLQIGLAAQLANVQAKRPHNVIDESMTKWMRYFWNWWFLNRIRRHQDFIGINYYYTDYYKDIKAVNPKLPLNDLGWYMEPEGLYPLLLRTWVRYKKPIIVTENGVADEKDQYRRWWLEETMVALERALSEGVDLRGYLHWSLLDNFEWAYGWWPRFGLVEVDMRDMKRKIRPSAQWWASWLKEARTRKNPEL